MHPDPQDGGYLYIKNVIRARDSCPRDVLNINFKLSCAETNTRHGHEEDLNGGEDGSPDQHGEG